MLVLSRQKDQTVMIGDNIEITVVDIRGDKVRLGITAPSHIPVHRKEVYEAIKRENKAAANVTLEDITDVGGPAPAKNQRRPGEPSDRSSRPPEKPAGDTDDNDKPDTRQTS